jgi:hypothetical protein
LLPGAPRSVGGLRGVADRPGGGQGGAGGRVRAARGDGSEGASRSNPELWRHVAPTVLQFDDVAIWISDVREWLARGMVSPSHEPSASSQDLVDSLIEIDSLLQAKAKVVDPAALPGSTIALVSAVSQRDRVTAAGCS